MHDERVRGVLDHAPETVLSFPQRLLGSYLIGDVADHPQEPGQTTLFVAHGGDDELAIEKSAILAAVAQDPRPFPPLPDGTPQLV